MPKKEPSIKLSPKYGLNPAIPKCFFCLEDKNELILPGRMRSKKGEKDVEAPRGMVWDHNPCDKCAEFMKQGIILISTKDGDTNSDNPYRTGGWVVVKEEALRRIIINDNDKILNVILERRTAFVPDSVWDMMGLPRGEITT